MEDLTLARHTPELIQAPTRRGFVGVQVCASTTRPDSVVYTPAGLKR
jgi:hypothetical protein